MEVKAVWRGVRISPLKARLVADLIRGLPVGKALQVLKHTPKKAARLLEKTLLSALGNAENNEALDIDVLHIARVFVDQGTVLKRMMPRAKGRGHRIRKPTSHLTVVLSEQSFEVGDKI